MRKVVTILAVILTLATVVTFTVFGGWSVLGLVVKSIVSGEDGRYLWRSFLKGGNVKDEVESLNGFWVGKRTERIWIWTAGGIFSYKLAPQTRYMFIDACSDSAREQRMKYGSRGTAGKYVTLIDMGKLINPGKVVSLKIRQKGGIVESLSYSNANYFAVFFGNRPDAVCD